MRSERPWARSLSLPMKPGVRMRSDSPIPCVNRAMIADYCLQPAKVARQFQQAEAVGAKYAVVIGQEWPQVRVKLLAERTERDHVER